MSNDKITIDTPSTAEDVAYKLYQALIAYIPAERKNSTNLPPEGIKQLQEKLLALFIACNRAVKHGQNGEVPIF